MATVNVIGDSPIAPASALARAMSDKATAVSASIVMVVGVLVRSSRAALNSTSFAMASPASAISVAITGGRYPDDGPRTYSPLSWGSSARTAFTNARLALFSNDARMSARCSAMVLANGSLSSLGTSKRAASNSQMSSALLGMSSATVRRLAAVTTGLRRLQLHVGGVVAFRDQQPTLEHLALTSGSHRLVHRRRLHPVLGATDLRPQGGHLVAELVATSCPCRLCVLEGLGLLLLLRTECFGLVDLELAAPVRLFLFCGIERRLALANR